VEVSFWQAGEKKKEMVEGRVSGKLEAEKSRPLNNLTLTRGGRL